MCRARRFPIESRGRRKKLREVGCVTAICAACFTLRAVIVAWAAADSADADLDVLDHPLLNLVGLLPSLAFRPATQAFACMRLLRSWSGRLMLPACTHTQALSANPAECKMFRFPLHIAGIKQRRNRSSRGELHLLIDLAVHTI